MKIALIGSKGIPARSGGVEKHTEELAVRLAQKGHQVLVYSRSGYTRKRQKNYRGVKIIYPPYIPTKNLAAITHTLTSIIHILFQKVDIIHIHSIGPSLLAFIPRLFKRKAKTIVTFHSRDRFNQKWGVLARLFLTLGEWTAVNFPHLTIAVSKTLYNFCQRKYPNKNIVYIPNGASLFPKLKPHNIKKWGLQENNYFLTVSRLIPLKGIHYLIQAFKSLTLNKKLVIVGEADQENKAYEIYLKHLVSNNSKIILAGEQRGKVLAELFSSAYLYVLPSEVEGLSVSLLEAMGVGRCPLVSDIKENKEAIGEIGYTFHSKKVGDLARMLNFLNDHPELVFKAGKSSRLRIRQFYNWNKIVNKTIKVYQLLLKDKEKSKTSIKEIYSKLLNSKSPVPNSK